MQMIHISEYDVPIQSHTLNDDTLAEGHHICMLLSFTLHSVLLLPNYQHMTSEVLSHIGDNQATVKWPWVSFVHGECHKKCFNR